MGRLDYKLQGEALIDALQFSSQYHKEQFEIAHYGELTAEFFATDVGKQLYKHAKKEMMSCWDEIMGLDDYADDFLQKFRDAKRSMGCAQQFLGWVDLIIGAGREAAHQMKEEGNLQ